MDKALIVNSLSDEIMMLLREKLQRSDCIKSYEETMGNFTVITKEGIKYDCYTKQEKNRKEYVLYNEHFEKGSRFSLRTLNSKYFDSNIIPDVFEDFILKTEIISNLQYTLNNIIGFIGCFIIIFTFFNLWMYIYDDPSNIINGYTMNQMIWYMVITEAIYMSVKGRYICKKIKQDIRSGNIAYNLNKPYNYILYNLSSSLGDVSTKLPIYLILGLLTGLLFLKTLPNINIISILIVLISMLLAIIINILLCIFIGLFSLFIEDSMPFYWIYSKLILILGTLFPIEYFPLKIQKIIELSPIYVVSYGPAKLFVDFSYNKSLNIIIMQLIYVIISYLICLLIYKKGVKKLNVNGG